MHLGQVARDDRVVFVFQRVGGLRERVADRHPAAAVVRVEQREVLAGEDVAGVHHAQRREDHERVAVRVAAAEVVQVDLIRALAERHLVLERPLRQPLPLFSLKMFVRRAGLIAMPVRRDHLLHVRLRVLLDDDVDGRRESTLPLT